MADLLVATGSSFLDCSTRLWLYILSDWKLVSPEADLTCRSPWSFFDLGAYPRCGHSTASSRIFGRPLLSGLSVADERRAAGDAGTESNAGDCGESFLTLEHTGEREDRDAMEREEHKMVGLS